LINIYILYHFFDEKTGFCQGLFCSAKLGTFSQLNIFSGRLIEEMISNKEHKFGAAQ